MNIKAAYSCLDRYCYSKFASDSHQIQPSYSAQIMPTLRHPTPTPDQSQKMGWLTFASSQLLSGDEHVCFHLSIYSRLLLTWRSPCTMRLHLTHGYTMLNICAQDHANHMRDTHNMYVHTTLTSCWQQNVPQICAGTLDAMLDGMQHIQ